MNKGERKEIYCATTSVVHLLWAKKGTMGHGEITRRNEHFEDLREILETGVLEKLSTFLR